MTATQFESCLFAISVNLNKDVTKARCDPQKDLERFIFESHTCVQIFFFEF